MKALILGHGFISTHLEKRLKKEEVEVIVISDKDIYNSKKPEYFDIDYIFRLSAYGNHYNQCLYNIDEWKMIEANIFNLFQLLDFSKEINYKAFINFSTSSVNLPVQTMYSATKHAGEHICQAFAKKYNKPIINIRPYSVFGTGEAQFRFIPMVIRCLETGESMPLDPNAVHDWILVDDFLDALFLILEKGTETIYDIGNGMSFTNLEIVTILEEISGKKLDYKFNSKLRVYDSGNWQCDIRKLKKLGWFPKHSLREGLAKTYAYRYH